MLRGRGRTGRAQCHESQEQGKENTVQKGMEIVSAYFLILHRCSRGYLGLFARFIGLPARLMFMESLGPPLTPPL